MWLLRPSLNHKQHESEAHQYVSPRSPNNTTVEVNKVTEVMESFPKQSSHSTKEKFQPFCYFKMIMIIIIIMMMMIIIIIVIIITLLTNF